VSALLELTSLRTTFGTSRPIEAVRGIDLTLAAGETLTLLGESGSGKSVTARSILRLYGRSARIEGSVQLAGTDLAGLDEKQMRAVRGRRIGLVPQDPSAALDPLRTIGSQLVEVLRAHGIVKDKASARGRARDLLSLVGINDPARVMTSRPHQLSGGMRQRAIIAVAVACEPELLIADEPTTALDVTVQAMVLDLFRDLQKRIGTALLLVTHDVGVAEELGGRVAVMYAGRIVESGATAEVLSGPKHPYTRGLLDSLPTATARRGELPVIPGRPPLTGEALPGCAFAPRCTQVQPSCTDEVPPLATAADGRTAACPVVNPLNLSKAASV
jgi:oligopeptide/dipeptide ABC transporter ATP-binding protein